MKDFRVYMEPGKRGHLIGIGGVSMSPLAEVLRGIGLSISGSSEAVASLFASIKKPLLNFNIIEP